MKRPLILVSNDDGIHAEGIKALASALSPLGDIIVVAPATDQSSISHAMSLNRPLRLWQKPSIETACGEISCFAVDGTPTDCVYMGVYEALGGKKPDLVVSGINHSGNLGNDVFYSGTVAAAMEGVFLGIPGVAFSLVGNKNYDFTNASNFAHKLCKTLLSSKMPNNMLLNVNIPKRVTQPGYTVTTLGHHTYKPGVDKRSDNKGQNYYWIGGSWDGYKDLDGTDCQAIGNGSISLTPLEVRLTNFSHIDFCNNLKIDEYNSNTAFTNTLNTSHEVYPHH